MNSVSLKAEATLRELKERAARERLEKLTERSVQIFEEEEEQSIDNEAAAEGVHKKFSFCSLAKAAVARWP